GTGVLVGPHLVLTAWHVVRDLFVPNGGNWQPDPGAAARVRVEFDAFLFKRRQSLVAQQPLSVPAHAAWCPFFRPCHAEELKQRLPLNLLELEGLWDFALIRLANPVGLDRRWAAIDPRVSVPRPSDIIYIFQHPAGAAQK